ncbi:nitrite reductase large subunit NirB [Paenibacillus alkaliterrae]|uniref:nitrite reductase large subunit NirB n=1 Tax=Paenibacillus alkaliterrae TaxID=320909 RepID=UPI001F2A139A|nr:nitrite reductase large subunit NirB [Paenibacillus alkaliterrae]MCF2939963.1 nitrite reductase large subunit NirB [Paenibacillus alkaliterrae]
MAKRKLVVIGNGMAGVRCVEEILNIDRDAFEITIFGKEPHPNYNRILLSKVLQGDTTIQDITINDWQWYEDNHIQLFTNETVTNVDTERKRIGTESGKSVKYDELIFATGSLPFMLPLPGANKKGVTAFRDIRDCETMVETSKSYEKAVVIGGGLLGLEAARGLLNLGMKVDVVHIFDSIMERQLDSTAAKMLQAELEKQGMRFLLEKQSEEIIGRSRVVGLKFKDGTKTDADLLVMAVGVRPNVQLAKEGKIETNRAIVVNDYMETSVPNVYAVGECAEHRGIVYGLVAPLYEQGKVLAKTLCGVENEGYHGSVLATQLKVSGVDVFSAGEFMDSDEVKSLKWIDGIRSTYKKIVIRDNKIVGAVLFGDISEGTKLLGMIKQQTDISVYEKEMNGAGARGQEAGEAAIAAMSDKELVCSCNGVSKGTIMQAIGEQGLQTVDEVKKCTKASSSCGSCKTMVSSILDYVHRHGFEHTVEKETVCACTTFSHDELMLEIQKRRFTDTAEIISALDWQTEAGCEVCRPALQYYLGVHGSAVLHAYEDMPMGIQADGTYAVTPKMYGGVTTPEQLRQIADIVEKYGIPLVKLLEGPQLGLLGIAAAEVKSVMTDLNIPNSGSEYGKTVSTIGTCSGIKYAVDAMQDSIALGIALEKKLERVRLPHEIKIGISASPHNRAGSLTKDIGIVGVPGGWEMYAGGSGERQVKPGQLLCTAATDEELLALVSAFLQYYRETGHYAELVAQWIERLGLLQIREALFDPYLLQILGSRMEKAFSDSPEQANQQPTTAAVTR